MKIFGILIVGATLFLSSCATIFTGTKQTVQIDSEPPGAKVLVDGIDRGYTPIGVSLKKGSDGQMVTLKYEGYKDKSFQPETTFNGVAALNLLNILFWGIDAATGAVWKYDPKYYKIEMEKVGE
jgi:hypothetical protein